MNKPSSSNISARRSLGALSATASATAEEKKLTKQQIQTFQAFIWQFYHLNKRDFAWRNVDNPYYVVVSELMLQQTQTHRVVPKFEQFIAAFPDFHTLAQASLRDVLSAWQGLGYNRRGKYLQQIAQHVIEKFNGELPNDINLLQTLPGIGPYTAGSVSAFAFNQPTVFIETNIRSVFIHSFYRDEKNISDKKLMPLIAQTIDRQNPREWYYGLMDYGVFLKKSGTNPNHKSRHYTKQSKFEGSDRQIRGAIIRLLTNQEELSEKNIINLLSKDKTRVKNILQQLCGENLIKQKDNSFFIEGDKI